MYPSDYRYTEEHEWVKDRGDGTCVLGITFTANIFLWPVYHGFMPVIAKEHLGLSPQGLGWLLACAGAGGLTGSLLIASLGDFRFKGGLFVLGRTTTRIFRSVDAANVVARSRIRMSVQLCTTYWHWLLLIWLGVFALLLST